MASREKLLGYILEGMGIKDKHRSKPLILGALRIPVPPKVGGLGGLLILVIWIISWIW
jgi:hypothetical protein